MAKDMTTGHPLKLILLFTIPVMIGNMVQQIYNMADAVIVGRFLGADALAAVGAVGSLMFLTQGFANGIAQGFGVAVSHAFGAKDHKLLKHYVAVSLMLTVIISLLITVPTVICCEKLLIWLNTPDNIMQMAYNYLVIILAGIVCNMAYNASAGILRGVGDSKTPLFFLIFSSALNIVLDIYMIVVLKLGTAGAAYATVIAQGVSALLCFIYMFGRFEILRIGREDCYLDLKTVKKMLSIGVPMAVNYSVTALGLTVMQSAVNMFGSAVVAAYTAASKVYVLAMQIPLSFGMTMSTYCGQNLGAEAYQRIFKGIRYAFLLSFVIAAVQAAACVFGGPFAVRLFIDHPSAEIVSYAMEYLKIASCFYVPLTWIFIYRNSLQGLDQGFIPMVSGLLEFFARYFTVKLFAGQFGYTAVCFADPATWVTTSFLLMATYYLWSYKKRKEVKG
ncbi:MAG: MATE family efflux transporter [Lachnospiraceae bacterium]|nr:MATE family efflux transporter [Lachnospiraceae bacterium]